MKKRFTLFILCFIILTQNGWTRTDNHSLIVNENQGTASRGFAAQIFETFQFKFLNEFKKSGFLVKGRSSTAVVSMMAGPCDNILTNPEFDNGISDWFDYSQSGSSGVLSVDNTSQLSGTNSAYVDITAASGTGWHIQVGQGGKSIESGETYTVSFDAKAVANRNMYVIVQLDASPYTEYWGTSVALTTTGTSYSFDFIASATVSNSVNLIFNFGEATDNVYFDNVSFNKVCGSDCSTSGTDDVFYEAECAAIGANFVSLSDVNASGEEYVGFTGASEFNNPATVSDDYIRFNVGVDASGMYKVFLRTKTTSGSDDSFWVRVNGGDWTKFNEIPVTANWTWHQVHDSDNGNTLVTFCLEEGLNTLDISRRENNAIVDKIYITGSGSAPVDEGGVSANCPDEFVCDTKFYQIIELSDEMWLYEVATNPVDLNPLINLTTAGAIGDLNSIVFRKQDGYIYALNTTSPYRLYRIASDYSIHYLGNVTGFNPSSSFINAGTVDENGNIIYRNTYEEEIYQLDLATLTATLLCDYPNNSWPQTNIGDLAYNPIDGKYYGTRDSTSTLVALDLSTCTENNITLSRVIDGANGAFYISADGTGYGYENSTGKFTRINLTTGLVEDIGQGVTTVNVDGCSCQGLKFHKELEVQYETLGDTATYVFTIYNNWTETLTNIEFKDTLTDGLTWGSEPYQVSGLTIGATSVTGNSIADFTLTNVPVGTSTFTLTANVPANYTGPNTYENTAYLEQIPVSLGSYRPSGDPTTPDIDDPTKMYFPGGCDLTNPYPGFPIDFLNNNTGWVDYDLGSNLVINDNGNGTKTITGTINNGTPVDFGSGSNGTSCGATDSWTIDLTLSDKKTWAEFQAMGGSANVHANCNADIANLEYWDIIGTLTGTGCNSGRTLTITGPKAPYRLQIGNGGNSGDNSCAYGMSTWFDINEGGTTLNADIYAFVEESCYDIEEICNNGIDDDGDGYIDELDSECFNCPSAPTSGILFSADFENTSGDNAWTLGTGASDGDFTIGTPTPYVTAGTNMEIAAHGGSQTLLTGSANGQDLDGGPTTAQSIDICLPSGATCINLDFYYYYSDHTNGDASDYLNIELRDADDDSVLETLVTETGNTAVRHASWTNLNQSIATHAGKTVYIYMAAADLGGGSKTEVAIDDISIQVCAEICGNGQDDDGDTLVDCDDNDCPACGEICGNGQDDDGDMLVDCDDPDCYALSLNSPTVSSCIDHPLRDVATVDVDVSWTNAPANDTIEVKLGDKTEYIDVAGGATSPQTVSFIVIADGSTGNSITTNWRNTSNACTTPTTFDAPAACSSDTIACNILYLCGSEKPYDGDPWDHGWIEYLDEINGTNTVTPILTKADGSGMGTYDPDSPSTFVNVTLTDYDLIVISATTENYLATDLIDDLKNVSASILNSNFLIINDLGMSTVEGGYTWGTAAYIDDATQVEIYNYDNINADYLNVFTRGDYRSNADAYLWAYNGNETSGENGYMFANTAADYFAGVSPHGFRVYLGYHMNGLYANPINGGAIPSPTSAWFSPEKHLTLIGKDILDQAIILAAPCGPEICDDGIDNDGDGYTDCSDSDCSNFIDIGADTTICLGDAIILNAQPSSTTTGTNYSYNWNIPNGYSSHTVNPVDLDTFFVRTGISGGCTWRDTIIVNVEGLLIGGVTVSDCYDSNGATAGGNSVVDIQVMIDWVNAPSGDQIQVAVDGATSQTFNPNAETAPHILTFTVPADGTTGNVTANFVTNTNICPNNATFTAPNGNCVETPCSNTGGTVWNDNNNDGVKDAEEVYGFDGVIVTADWDDCAGNTGTVVSTTDAYGQYDLAGIPLGAMVRVTFSNLPSDYTCMEGSVSQISTAPNCSIDLGLTDCTGAAAPAWLQKGYSVVTCLPGADKAVLATKDITSMGTLWDTPSNRGYNQSGSASTIQMWTIDQFNDYKVLGIAVDKRNGTIYVGTSAMIADVQHSGGTVLDSIVYPIIYKITPEDITPRPFAMMPGRLGVGSMDIDYQHNQLFATDIDGGKIYRFDMQSGQQKGAAFDPLAADNGVLFEVPELGDFINGIGYNEVENKIYYGVYYNQYKHNAWVRMNDDFNTIRSIQLDANGAMIGGTDTEEIILPKITDPASFAFSHGVADIEFNEAGDKVLFAEMGVNRYEYYSSFSPYELYDVSYKANTHTCRVLEYYDNGGTWTMSPVFSGNYNSKFDIGNQNDNEGLNARGGVDWAYKSVENGEITGLEDFILATGDRLTNGTNVYGYQFTPSTGGDYGNSILANLGSATGSKYTFADVEVYKGVSCEKRIAIGDLVWYDENKDGLQDICEPGLDNVTMQLYDDACQLIASTTTTSSGYYLFDHTNVDTTGTNGASGFTGLSANSTYHVVLGDGQYVNGGLTNNSTSYILSTANVGSNDNLDSDAAEGIACGSINSLPFITVNTGIAGCLNSGQDFGFSLGVEICGDGVDNDGDGLVDCFDPACNPNAPAVTGITDIIVNSTGDKSDTNPGDGICATEDCECTLRAAIEEANALAGQDTIYFNIAGAGPHIIIPMSDYEGLNEAVYINAYSQPGAVMATASTPATIKIEIDGSNLTTSNGVLQTNTDGNEISGLAINGHDANIGASAIKFWSNNNHVWGCYIGIDANGSVAIPNSRGIINFAGDDNTIGGSSVAERNVISGNQYMGISLEKNGATNLCDNTIIQGNFIGTDASGTNPLGNLVDGIDAGHSEQTSILNNVISGNGQDGIEIDGPNASQLSDNGLIQGNFIGTDISGTLDLGNGYRGIFVRYCDDLLIGGLNAGEENIITHNNSAGIVITEEESDDITILRNSIYDNNGLGIDLSNGLEANGVTNNDADDADTGANDLLNFPELNKIVSEDGELYYSFQIDVPEDDYRIEFFKNTIGDASGHGEGEIFIGAVNIDHPGNGNVQYTGTFTPLVAVSENDIISTTATHCTNSSCTAFSLTSEFSGNANVTICGTSGICLASGDWSFDCSDNICAEVEGIGIKGQASGQIEVTDSSSVQFIVVEATFSGGSNSPDEVTFSSANGESVTVAKQYFVGESGSSGDRYFQAELMTSGTVYVNYPANATARGESFVAYVFRDCEDQSSVGKFTHRRISNETYSYSFNIPTSNQPRDILIEVPLAEITNDNRIANISATAGGVSKMISINSYNQGNSLNITPFTLENVPDTATVVTITVESPSGGQSLYLSGAATAKIDCDAALTVIPSANVVCAEAGQNVTYTYSIFNYSNHEITNIIASDALTGNINLGLTTLQPGQNMGTTSNYTVQAADFPGPLQNTITISGTDAVTAETITKTFSIDIPLTGASLSITADRENATVGDTIIYTYQIDNLGNSGLVLDLSDDLIGNVLDLRASDGLQVLYTFDEGSGSIIHDISGVGDPLDLTIENPANTTWGSSFLSVNSETRATNTTVNSKVHQSCLASNEVSLEVWVKPANNTQGTPARMLGYSLDGTNRNVQLAQENNDYNARLRTSNHITNELFGTGNHINSSPVWQHVVYTYDGTDARLYVNGVHISDNGQDNPTGDFSTWDASYALVLFNEYLDSRAWLGDMGLAAIYSKALSQTEIDQNYNLGYEDIIGYLAAGESLTWTSEYIVQSSDFPSPLTNQATLVTTSEEGCSTTVQDDTDVRLCTNADCIEYCNDGIDNDGDGLADCDDDDCVSISDAGTIDGEEKECGAFDPGIISNTALPSNHNGNTIQYEWEQSTDFGYSWTIISGALSESYDPSTITITTRYRRKARLFDCDPWEISNAIIKKVVEEPTANNDSFNSCPGVIFSQNVRNNDIEIDNPSFSITEMASSGTVTIDSTGEFTYSPSGVNCAVDQFTYQVCNDETSCCDIAVVTINLADGTAPNLVNVPADITLECTETIPELPLVLAIDNCPAISINTNEVSTQTETGCGRFSYTITRTWLAADFCGNDVSESQIITVQDTTPPTFTAPATAYLPCSEDKDDLTITGDATDELDNCSTNLQAVYTDNLSTLNLPDCRGYIIRTWTLSDVCGNVSSADQYIYIFDDTDRDKDGTPDGLDLDDDNDGIPDVDETYADTDGDGITNNLDLDSDNDGIPDILEAGFIDSNGDGVVDNLGLPGWDDDGDGFADGFDANDMDTSLVASDNFEPLTPIRDRDGDGVTNFWDLDSDNDGVGDLIESGGVDTNGDGLIDYPTISDPTSMIDIDNDGFADVYDPDNDGNPGTESPNQPLLIYNGVEYTDGRNLKDHDTDGDDIPNLYDLDCDNDGISDLIEAGGIDIDGDGKIDLIGEFEDANGDGFHDNYSVLSLMTTDPDGATIDGRPEDDDADGTPYNGCDFDQDGIPNQLDVESDGDGILDIIEIGNAAADTDGDGRLDNTTDMDKDGFDDNLAALGFISTDGDGATDDGRPEDDGDSNASPFNTSSADGSMAEDNGEVDIDDDGDAALNFLDLDSDGDLIPDMVEDTNQNGIQDPGETNAYDSDSDDDLIRDGIEDTNINGIFEPGETDPLNPNTDGDPLDDGVEDADQNGVVNFGESDPRDPCDPFLNESCIGIALNLKIKLQGALIGTIDTLMRDDLRTQGVLPLQEPYLEMDGFAHRGSGGGEVIDTSLLMISGPNAIVDWVLVELRDPVEPGNVLATRSALLQRDGDVVDTSGLAPLWFPEMPSGSYYVAVRHRNHLGVMTYGTYILSPQAKTIDFTVTDTQTYGGQEAQYKSNNRMHLWAGDINSDHKVIYQGPQNDVLNMFLEVLTEPGNVNYYANYVSYGYHNSDVNMDGKTIYQGPGNDRAKLLIDIVLKHVGNTAHLANYAIWEQMPQ